MLFDKRSLSETEAERVTERFRNIGVLTETAKNKEQTAEQKKKQDIEELESAEKIIASMKINKGGT